MTNKQIVKLAQKLGDLKRIKRTGWVLKGIREPESVADHVFRTSLLVLFLSENTKLDKKKLLEIALIHDLGETQTADIRYEEGKKIIASKEAKYQIEQDAVKRLFSHLKNQKYYFKLWQEFRYQTSPEARFVQEVEKLEMAIQAFEYEETGVKGRLLDEFWENADQYISHHRLRELFEYLRDKRRRKREK